MRRILLSVLAGVALISATAVLLHGASANVSPPVMNVSAQLVSVAPSALAPRASPQPTAGSGLEHRLAQFRSTHSLFPPPAVQLLKTLGKPLSIKPRRPGAIRAPSLILPPQGMSCPAAGGSSPGGCSIVPCAVYVGAGQTSSVVSTSGLGLAILPKATVAPAAGGHTPAGTCVSRPGRPPQMRWVSSAGR